MQDKNPPTNEGDLRKNAYYGQDEADKDKKYPAVTLEMSDEALAENAAEKQRIAMHLAEIVKRANSVSSPWGFRAEIFENAFSVGVGGDERTYLPALCLNGPFIGWEKLEEIAREICNTLPVNRVVYDLSGLPADTTTADKKQE